MRAGERIGLPAPISAAVIVGAILAAAGSAITLLAEPAGEWIARAPEIGAQLKEKLYVLDRPLAALRALKQTIAPPDLNSVTVNTGMTELLTPLLALLTPAATQILLFLITLIFFLAGQQHMRNSLVALMPSREAKLRMLRIESDVRQNLAGYVGVVAAINTALGAGTAALAWASAIEPAPPRDPGRGAQFHSLSRLRPDAACSRCDRTHQFPDADAGVPRPASVRRHDHDRRPHRDADHTRPQAHAQSGHGRAQPRVLDLAVGPGRRLSRRAAVDHRARDAASPPAGQRSEAAELTGTLRRAARSPHSLERGSLTMTDIAAKSANSMKEKRAYEGANDASQDIQKDLQTLQQDVSKLAAQLAQLAGAKGADALRIARANIDGVVSEAGAKGREAAEAVRDVRDNLANAVDKSITNRPYTTLAMALALGFVFGATWRR
ncbi:MAG: hypothetical protein M5U33_02205 [Pseudorhodoplanes sp.]|nr:hypothetical protein [Pseudorhodoplanes sp.]